MKTKPRAGKLDKYIGNKLKEFRLSYNVSQVELAEVGNMTFQQIQKYESGKNRISASTLYLFAEYFDEPIKRFFPE